MKKNNLVRLLSEEVFTRWKENLQSDIERLKIPQINEKYKIVTLPNKILYLPELNVLINDIREERPVSNDIYLPFPENSTVQTIDGLLSICPSQNEAVYIFKLFVETFKRYSSKYAVTCYLDNKHIALTDTSGHKKDFNEWSHMESFYVPVAHVPNVCSLCVLRNIEYILANENDRECVKLLRFLLERRMASWDAYNIVLNNLTYDNFVELFMDGGINLENYIFPDKDELLKRDFLRCDLTPYDESILTDSCRGHWELWDPENIDGDIEMINLGNEVIYARNPACDINRNSIVAIDFGTKSTVAVILDEESNYRPIRIGTGDFSKVEDNQYENPTVIQFLNFAEFMDDYKKCNGRPQTKFNDLCVSHNAYNALKGSANSGYKHFVSKIKQYAGGGVGLRKSDDQSEDIKIKPYFELTEEDIDIVEIYAYYIGLYINNMYRKIFMNYTLSMPVNFEEAVRTRIMKSFEKGIKKSLPEALWNNKAEMERFSITASNNESAAYAVTALTQFGFEPEDDEKVFYGVFDFGGGTTDFDFGFWRGANSKERRYDYVITYYDDEGDVTLGGENILDILAYTVWCDNIDIMRQKKIPINIPSDCSVIPNCELLICSDTKSGVRSPSDESSFNNWKLAEDLRWIWEENSPNKDFFSPNFNEENIIVDVNAFINAIKEKIQSIEDTEDIETNVYVFKNDIELLNGIVDSLEEQYSDQTLEKSELIKAIGELCSVSEESLFFERIATSLFTNDYYVKKPVETYSYTADLYNLDGFSDNKITLIVDFNHLRAVIEKRIEKGVSNFFDCLRKNARRFMDEEGETDININIFLAGNSCKSIIVEELFNKYIERELEQVKDSVNKKDYFTLFYPLGTEKANKQIADRGIVINENEIQPNCKTGVAYGLLLSRNGGKIKVVDNRKVSTIFDYYIGYEKKKKFIHITDKSISFEKWYEFIDASEAKFELFYTTYPEAVGNSMPIESTKKVVCDIDIVDENAFVYYRPISANQIEYVVASNCSDGKINDNDMLTKPVVITLG